MTANAFSFVLDLFFPKQNLEYSSIHTYLTVSEIEKFKPEQIPSENSELFSGLYSFSSFQNNLLADLIHRAKFNGELEICTSLADIILFNWQKAGISKPDIITFIPPDKKRFTQRQYHIPQKIAKIVAGKLGVRIQETLFKTRATKSQVGLTKEERLTNLSAAFEITQEVKEINFLSTKFPIVWLIDDVYTTGTTFKECAGVLKRDLPNWKIIGLAISN